MSSHDIDESAPQGQRPRLTWSRANGLVLLALVLACSAGLALFADMPIARWIHGQQFPGDLHDLVRLCEAFAHGSTVALIVLGAMAIDPRKWRVLPRLVIAAFGSGLLADFGKLLMGRTRPKAFDVSLSVRESFLGFFSWREAATWQEALQHSLQSFPSGHAATAAGLACALSRLYPRGSWFFAVLTLLACFQRVESGAHYLSDVLAGATIGVLVNLALELPRTRDRLARFESPLM